MGARLNRMGGLTLEKHCQWGCWYIYISNMDILGTMTKRLVEIPDELLVAAQAALGTATMKDTVNQALINSVSEAEQELDKALLFGAAFDTTTRENAWR